MNNIESKLEKIFLQNTGIDFNKNKLKNELFFSNKLRLQARDLVLVLYSITKEFNIQIPEEKLLNKEFNSFSSVLKIINSELI